MEVGGILVEVLGTCDGMKLFYEATLVDKVDDKAIVRFRNNFQHKVKVEFSQVRLAPKKQETPLPLGKGTEVEVYFGDSDHCWQKGIVKNTIDDFVAVSFDKKKKDLVSISEVRSANKECFITSDDIYVFELTISEKYSKFAGDPTIHSMFLSSIKAECCINLPDDSQLKIISTHPDCPRFGKTLFEFHLDRLEQRFELKSAIEKEKKFLENLKNESVTEELEMDHTLIGLAIGTRGKNILKARYLPGIKKVELLQNTFHITGENKECVTKARSMLEFKCGYTFVPRYLKNKIITKAFMEHIQKHNFVSIKIKYIYNDDVPNDNSKIPHKPDHCSILMAGLADNIAAVKLQIDFLVATHLDSYKMQRRLNILPQNGTSNEGNASGDTPEVYRKVSQDAKICQDETSKANDIYATNKLNDKPQYNEVCGKRNG